MITNKELLAIAKKQIGNTGGKYRSYAGYGGSWCNMYVYWLFNANGCGSLFPMKTKYQKTYCPTSIEWCRKNLAEIPLYLAMPCDIFYMDWDKNRVPNHIGIAEKHDTTGAIYTIEGNTSGGKVDDKHREGKYNCGLFRPHFKASYKIGLLNVDGDCGYSTIAMLQTVLGGCTVDGILGISTVKRLQQYLAITQDGQWGPGTSKAVQKLVGVKQDGAFGPASVKGLQNWINKKYKPNSYKPVPAPKPSAPVKASYSGAFPDLVTHSGQKIAYTARDLAWAKGTAKSKYTYPKGSAKTNFKTAINKVYPKRSKWSKQCQAGASCDVGAGTIIRYAGIDPTVPRGLQEQIPHFKKSTLWKNTGQSKCTLAGDVALHASPGAHIWIGLGDGNLAEANHTWKFFEHITTDKRSVKGKPKGAVYRCTKASPIKKGDRGTEVKKLQAFLNWAGFNCGAADGVAGANTDAAIRAFQKANGLTADGEFGSASLTKAKAFKK
jgi:peptidoglycan hydrolase-like protein with peptidoglycan-binding domain